VANGQSSVKEVMNNSALESELDFQPALLVCKCGLPTAMVFAPAAVPTQSAQAQTFTVLHNFTNGADGGEPAAGLSMDRAVGDPGTIHLVVCRLTGHGTSCAKTVAALDRATL